MPSNGCQQNASMTIANRGVAAKGAAWHKRGLGCLGRSAVVAAVGGEGSAVQNPIKKRWSPYCDEDQRSIAGEQLWGLTEEALPAKLGQLSR
jgi:hypothetical protein